MLEYVRQHGPKPRYRGNRLLFLAPDMAVLSRVREVVRVALAWESIVKDVNEGRLNIDRLQEKQAKNELKSAEDVLPRAARECYKWLLGPMRSTPSDPKPGIEAFPLGTGGDSPGSELERVCEENELVISTWSPIHVRDVLKQFYWKDDKAAVRAMDFWEDSLGYLYLPRLKDRSVFAAAIRAGTESKDFFGTAYGQQGETFEGFHFGGGGQLDDTLLLIHPAAAAAYEASIASPARDPASTVDSGSTGLRTDASEVLIGGTERGTDKSGTTPISVRQVESKPTSFYGSIDIRLSAAKMRLVQVADEIINVLVSDPNASLKVAVEIHAEYPTGVSEQIKRAVSENANSLGFKTNTWE